MNELELTIKNLTIVKNGIKKVFEKQELKFNMAQYRQEEINNYSCDDVTYDDEYNEDYEEIDIDCIDEVNNPTCGSCCCALGGIPSITGLEAIKELDFSFCTMNYTDYSKRVFPFLEITSKRWHYLFGVHNYDCIDSFVDRANEVIKELRELL